MSFVYDALTKAEREGKIDSTWVPQEEAKPRHSPPEVKLPRELVENFTMLKHNVQMAHVDQSVQTIAITSSVSGEGCSTIAHHLSLILAQSLPGGQTAADDGYTAGPENLERGKNRILVIDGNLKAPGLHRMFGVDPKLAIHEFVLTPGAGDHHTISISPHHLNLITSGKMNGNSHDIWVSLRIKSLLDKLRSQFEYIIIDAPPIINHPETLALSKLTDGVLFVIKANETRLEIIEQARGQLDDAGVKVLGVVLNERRFFIPGGIYRRI